MVVRGALAVAMLAMLLGCRGPDYSRKEAQAFSSVVHEVAAMRVTAYRNQDWCKNLQYERGTFSETDFPTTCNIFTAIPVPFDDQAKSDFEWVRSILSANGVAPTYFELDYAGATNGPVTGYFEVGCSNCDFGRYVLASSPPEGGMALIPNWWWVEGR